MLSPTADVGPVFVAIRRGTVFLVGCDELWWGHGANAQSWHPLAVHVIKGALFFQESMLSSNQLLRT